MAAISGGTLFGAEPDLLLVAIVAIAVIAGSIPGAVSGFAAGLLVDVMTLGTLGFTSLLLTLAGYWSGRYGETTGRGRGYAPSATAFAMTLVVGLAATALHFLLGDAAVTTASFAPLLPSGLFAAFAVIPAHRVCRVLLGHPETPALTREVELV